MLQVIAIAIGQTFAMSGFSAMNRKEFLNLSKAIIGGLACHGTFGLCANAQSAAGWADESATR